MRNKRKHPTIQAQMERQLKYSIRKFKGYGAASVAIASTLVFLGNYVQATETAQVVEETVVQPTTNETSSPTLPIQSGESTEEGNHTPNLNTPKYSVQPSTEEEISHTAKQEKPTVSVPLTEGTALRNAADATDESVSITYFDPATGRDLSPQDIINGGDGTNMRIGLRLNVPSNLQNGKVELNLGPFLEIVDTGSNSDSLKDFVEHVSAPIFTEVKVASESNDYYRSIQRQEAAMIDQGEYQSFSLKRKVIYTLKSDVTSTNIVVTVRVHPIIRAMGFAKDGEINGKTEGIEKTDILTAKVTGSIKDRAIEQNFEFTNEIEINNVNPTGRQWSTESSINISMINATNENEYKAKRALHLFFNEPDWSNRKQYTNRYFLEKIEYTITLPKGVSYVSHENSEIMEKLSSEVQENGETVIIFRSNKPLILDSNYIMTFETQVDRSIIKADSYSYSIDIKYKLRNHPEQTLATNNKAYVGIMDLNEGEHIVSTPSITNNLKSYMFGDQPYYVSLGGFGYGGALKNLKGQDTSEKELVIKFPENEFFEVKGLFLTPYLMGGTQLDSVLVKTKEVPEGKRVPINGIQKLYTVKDLGFEESDVLKEIIAPLGVLKAYGTWGPRGALARNSYFGNVLKPTPNSVLTATLSIRDKGYNEENPSPTANPVATFKSFTNLIEQQAADYTYVKIVNTTGKTVSYEDKFNLEYRIGASQSGNETAHENSISTLDKVYVVLPKSILVKGFSLMVEGKNEPIPMSEIAQTQETKGDNIVYTLDFSSVSGNNKYIGQITDKKNPNILGNHSDWGSPTNIQSIKLTVMTENRVEQETILKMDNTIFVKTVEERKNTGNQTIRNDHFDLDGDNLTDTDRNVFKNQPFDGSVTYSKAQRLSTNTEAKLSDSDTYTNANDNFIIYDRSQDLQLKYSLENTLTQDIGSVDLLLPIPKLGQNWGSEFQTKAFEYGFDLKGAITSDNPLFTDIFDVSYASIPASELDGTKKTYEQLIQKNFETTPADFSTVNLVRIKTKSNKKIPANSSFGIVPRLRIENASSYTDGKNNTWNSIVHAVLPAGSLVSKNKSINIDVKLGRAAIVVFDDVNMNGTKDETERLLDNVTVTVSNSQGKVVATQTTNAQGRAYIKELSAAEQYTVRVVNPSVDTTHFTTHTIADNNTGTSFTITPTITEEHDTQNTYVGLTNTKVNVNFNAGTDGNLNGGDNTKPHFYNDKITAPTPTPNAGHTFMGWQKAGSSIIQSVADLAKVTVGKEELNYTAKYVESKQTVTANVSWNNGPLTHPSITLELHKDGVKVSGQDKILSSTETTATWTNLDSNGNYTVVVKDVPNYTSSVDSGTAQTTDLPTDLIAHFKDQAGPYTFNTKTTTFNATINYQIASANYHVNIVWQNKPQDANPETSVTLKNGGQTVETQALAAGVNTHTFTDKPTTTNDGTPINYVLEANDVRGYSKVISYDSNSKTFTVTYTYASNSATLITPVMPAQKVLVKDQTDLSSTEKERVIQAIKNAPGQHQKVKDANITVLDDGSALIVYTDNSTYRIESSSLVEERPATAEPTINNVDTDDKVITGTGVPGATIIVTLPGGTISRTTVLGDNSWSVSTPLNTLGQVISVVQEAPGQKPSQKVEKSVVATTADGKTINTPKITKVVNSNALTSDEQAAVKAAVHAANTDIPLEKISVDNKGNVTITFDDQSIKTIDAHDTVLQKSVTSKPFVNPIDTDDLKITGTGVDGAVIEVTLPDTTKKTTTVVGGKWSVDLDSTLAKDATVSVRQTAKDEIQSAPTTVTVDHTFAEKTEPNVPSTKIPVDNKDSLTPQERKQVEDAMKTANATLTNIKEITVSETGEIVVSYLDGSTETVDKDRVIAQKDPATTPVINPIRSDATEITGTGPIDGTVELTVPGVGTVSVPVGPDGNWKFGLANPLQTGNQVSIVAKKAGFKDTPGTTVTVTATQAELADLKAPDPKVLVSNPNEVSIDEAHSIREAIKSKNSSANLQDDNIKVDPNGRTTIQFPDGSTKVFEPGVVIEGKQGSVKPTVNPIHNQSTTITGKGKKGATITVRIPGSQTPLTYVIPADAQGTDGEIEWSINIPDGTSLKANQTILVIQTEENKNASAEVPVEVQASQADSMEKPLFPVKVNDANNLSDTEIATIKQLIKDKVPSLGEDAIVVAPNGKVTITFPDGSTKIFEGTEVVAQKEVSGSFTVNPVDSNDTTISGTGLSGAKVKIYVKGNPSVLLKDDITVTPNGTWTADIPAQATDTQLEIVYEEQDKLPNTKIITVQPTLAEKQILVTDGFTKVKVDDANALTDTEKLAVENEVRRLNTDLPEHTKVEVALDGTVTIKYPDGTSSTIEKGKVVEQKERTAYAEVDPLDSDDKVISGTAAPNSSVEITLPGSNRPIIVPVNEQGKWSYTLSNPLEKDGIVSVVAVETGKLPSLPKLITVKATAAEEAGLVGLTDNNRVWVDNVQDLTDDEIGKVIKAIKDANPNKIDDVNVTITVNDQGVATITFKDGSTKVFQPAETIRQKEQLAKPTVTSPIHTQTTVISGTGVVGATIIVTLPDGTKLQETVSNEGKWSVTLPKSFGETLQLSVQQRKENWLNSEIENIQVKKAQADSVDETALTFKHENPGTYDFMPGTVYVVDPSALTPEEEDKVSDKVKEKVLELMEGLPQNQKDALVVDVQGEDVIITYEDQSIDKIKVSKVVTKIQQSPVVVVVPTVYDFMTTLRGKGIPGSTVTIEILPPASATQGMPVSYTAIVKPDGTWEIKIVEQLVEGNKISITQQIMHKGNKHPGWALSEKVEIFVKKFVPLPPQDPNQGEQDQPQTPEKPGGEDVIIVPIDPNSNVIIRPLHQMPGTIIVPNGQKPGVQETKPTSELTDPTKQKDGKGTLPNTGEVSTAWSVVAAAGMTLAGAITLFKKKKEDE